MDAKYPNLELIDYKARLYLSKDEKWKEKFDKIKENYRFIIRPNLHAVVFSQLWGSTCTGFDIIVHDDGTTEPAFGGAAMTEAYTTVMHESYTDYYLVFIGDKLCYVVDEPNEAFLDDLKERQLAGLSRAREIY